MARFYIWIVAIFCFGQHTIFSQTNFNDLESTLAFHCDIMVNAAESRHRMIAQKNFNTAFAEALHSAGSYSYPFDSLKWISKKSPKDNSFRIFTWEVKESSSSHHYFGYLQTPDGKMYELKDGFGQAEDLDEEFTPSTWLGAIYYNLMEVSVDKNQKYYLLFGQNKWNKYESKKLVDVLFFTKENEPIFGKPVFKISEKGEADVFKNRLIFTYAADAQMTANYNPGMDMIVYDNLIPRLSRIDQNVQTMVPDGSYVGYQWDKKHWVRVDKIATEVMDKAPRPKPILDDRKGKKIFGN